MSDVESMTPEEGMEDLTGWFKERLSGQETAPAAKTPAGKVTEQPSEEEDAEEDEDDLPNATANEEEGDDEPEDEDDENSEESDLAEFELKGKKYQIPRDVLAEIEKRGPREADYTRKTQEVAEQRKAAEQLKAEAQQRRQEYLQGLQIAQLAAQAFLPQPPPASMRDDDPIEYMRQKEAYQDAMQKFQALQYENQRVQKHQEQEYQREAETALKEAAAKLPELIPSWRDPNKAAKGKKELADYLIAQGYDPKEVGNASDPRAIALSWKAMQWDRAQAKKAASAPVAPKTTKPGPARNPSSESAALKSKRALAKTGRPEDGFAYFKSLMYGKR